MDNIEELIIFQKNLYNEFESQDLNYLQIVSKKLLEIENKNQEVNFIIDFIKNHISVVTDSIYKLNEIKNILDIFDDQEIKDKKSIDIYLECKNILNNFLEVNKSVQEHYNIILKIIKNY